MPRDDLAAAREALRANPRTDPALWLHWINIWCGSWRDPLDDLIRDREIEGDIILD